MAKKSVRRDLGLRAGCGVREIVEPRRACAVAGEEERDQCRLTRLNGPRLRRQNRNRAGSAAAIGSGRASLRKAVRLDGELPRIAIWKTHAVTRGKQKRGRVRAAEQFAEPRFRRAVGSTVSNFHSAHSLASFSASGFTR